MNLGLLLVLLAVAASLLLVFQQVNRTLPIIALAVSGLEALMRLGVLRFDIRGLPLGLLLGAALAVVGVLLYLRVNAKLAVAASTCITLAGAAQVLGALRL